ncbi:MAG: DoxX family protein [Flavobacteriaceae bacterium]|nr:DoxX family protein [Flavobacteriaceae bacterium]
MKTTKIIYWVATGLLSAMMLMSAGMYLFNNAEMSETFTKLGFPTYIIYPLAILKILGIIVILTNKSRTIKEWAYVAFFFNFILALSAHLNANDGEFAPAILAIIFLIVSYIYNKKLITNE